MEFPDIRKYGYHSPTKVINKSYYLFYIEVSQTKWDDNGWQWWAKTSTPTMDRTLQTPIPKSSPTSIEGLVTGFMSQESLAKK